MEPILLRFIERMIVVIIGGMAIYLGYRLFLKVPEHRDSQGKITLPHNISIIMTRVGPGVFFALFGVVAVSLSLLQPLQLGNLPPEQKVYDTIRYMSEADPDPADQLKDARALLRKDIADLNAILTLLDKASPEPIRAKVKRDIARIKFRLIEPLWGSAEEGFGDIQLFERWIKAGEPQPAPKNMQGALELYHYGSSAPG